MGLTCPFAVLQISGRSCLFCPTPPSQCPSAWREASMDVPEAAEGSELPQRRVCRRHWCWLVGWLVCAVNCSPQKLFSDL